MPLLIAVGVAFVIAHCKCSVAARDTYPEPVSVLVCDESVYA